MSQRRLSVPGHYQHIQQICELVSLGAEEAGMSEQEVFHCQLAVDEACTNIIEHGYGGEGRGQIDLACEAREGELIIVLHDSGGPFDPTTVPQPGPYHSIDDAGIGGHGLFFMRRVMDTVDFTRDGHGNVLVMTKRRGA